jgi:choline-sulfatase
MPQPNILFIMTDQQRFDTIASLGNEQIYTPNLDRLVRRGVTFTNAYSPCPVCVPARYAIRTGCEPPTTRSFTNGIARPAPGQAATMEGRCGPYLARTMRQLGYRTFGIGKFHSQPWDEDLGFEAHLHSEELYGTADQRSRDAYAGWIAREHPEFDYIEALMGERTEMYYMPQVSPLPAELTVERWAADRAVEQIAADDGRPYFGFVSFIGPHPPFAPPVPFNRMYDPDRMPNPVRGDLAVDHMDEQIPWMNQIIWAEDINDSHARVLKARYYGEISYIDDCLGRILDAVEARGASTSSAPVSSTRPELVEGSKGSDASAGSAPVSSTRPELVEGSKGADAANTIICFFTDHGDHLGDHHAWQKESFFEASCHIPFLVSWPARLPADMQRAELVSLVDLFGIATGAAMAGQRPTTNDRWLPAAELRDGIDLLGVLAGTAQPREFLTSMYGEPGTPLFKIMVRQGPWKYIFLANGGREQLFNVVEDPQELHNQLAAPTRLQISLLSEDQPASEAPVSVAQRLRRLAVQRCRVPGAAAALQGDDLRAFPYRERPRDRIYQFDRSRGVTGFPARPEDVLKATA